MTDTEKQLSELDKALILMAGQVGSLTAGSVKMESAIGQLSDTMQVLARSKMTIEHHEEKIDVLFEKTDKLEDWQKEMTTNVNTSCSLKTKEISAAMWKSITLTIAITGAMFVLFIGAVLYFNAKVVALELDATTSHEKIMNIEKYQNRNFGFLKGSTSKDGDK